MRQPYSGIRLAAVLAGPLVAVAVPSVVGFVYVPAGAVAWVVLPGEK